MRTLLSLVLAFVLAAPAVGQVAFTSSDLPIVLLDTDGQEIPDEPKITARMQVIDNGPGQRNHVTDTPTDYDGWIGIERRGSSSQDLFPKKQYGVETRDADGEDLDVALLGMPEESDWVLYAPYSDKSLMRNVLAYGLARRMGRYASRTRFCEVVLNGRYDGVYVFMEKIKRDGDRVDLNNLKDDETEGDDLTGGYIVKIDKSTGGGVVGGWASPFLAATGRPVRYLFEDPKADEIVPEQSAYIESFMTDFETVMASDGFEDPATGYPAIIDVGAFVDYALVTEVGRNIDGYRLSAFFHKDKDSNDPLLHAGPVWDYNLAFGNANYYGGEVVTGFQVDFAIPADEYPVPTWWPRLVHSASFRDALKARWVELRTGPLHTDSLLREIDDTAALLAEAQARNFQRWPVLGEYVWPNAYVGETYADEVAYLKDWVVRRMAWLDADISRQTRTEPLPESGISLSAPRPNPVRDETVLTLGLAARLSVTVDVVDVQGRRVAVLHDGLADDGMPLRLDASGLAAGVYVVRARWSGGSAQQRVAVVR